MLVFVVVVVEVLLFIRSKTRDVLYPLVLEAVADSFVYAKRVRTTFH